MIALNQTYRIAETLAARPQVRRLRDLYQWWALTKVAWEPHTTDPSLDVPGHINVGRSYDCAIALASVDFIGKRVAELGARASFFGSYLTGMASAVHMSDVFVGSFRGLGTLDHWDELWRRGAPNPDRLTAEAVDMRDTPYPDASFDVVVSFSAIEHIPGDGDIQAASEMGRICRPGGYVVIGTDMSDQFRRDGGYYYDEPALWDRIINPTGCEMLGPHDFTWATADHAPHKSGAFEKSSCIFVLRKP